MSDIVYLDGHFVPREQAKVSVFDRGFLFADAVYEVTAVIDSQLIDFSGHFQRLQRSCKELGLSIPITKDQLINIHHQLIEKNNLHEGLIYLQITRGTDSSRFFDFPPSSVSSTIVAFVQHSTVVNHPNAKEGISVISVEDIRWQRCDIKTVALLAACLAKHQAHQQGADDAILIKEGYITEGSSSNFFIVNHDNEIITRPLSQDILPGITRQAIIQLAKEEGLKIIERRFTLDEAKKAKEAFISSATTLIWPVISIDNQDINQGAVGYLSQRLREIYLDKTLKK
ncbi:MULTISPECIES: D-amino-acid transaminase [unclassified Proteus (in: enterobacteria)]|uniref:D-amino-acid transaminase n=1 Tax=unclassified Proteus (in: enterobacteria) TaxID=257482 RepID=UPI001379056A|nr:MULTISPECIES: D-amino-acid transaminase [unclassified Proteus (in: enterobacteria)]NBM48347.1 D-amino-acid transaminase [Proteus sp. G2666]NBM70272.1 D-amino-acid transaminase [Proteus sp. G2663]